MNDLDALLAGIVAHPHEPVRWLIVADWLDDHGFADRAELLRLHRMLIDTCCEPDQHPERAAWQARIVELIDQGVKPCVPQHTLMLPGGVPLVGSFIPPGSFLMGSEDGEDDEKPIHKVTITKGFFVGIFPVTQKQWAAVIGNYPSGFNGDELPVDHVSWNAASAFCAELTNEAGYPVRLPTEAEWEYVCRAGTVTHYHWGDAPDTHRMNASGEWTTYDGDFAQNPWGLFDCHGNVEEWCRDWSNGSDYASLLGTDVDPVLEGGDFAHEEYITRGGSWFRTPQECRSASRARRVPTDCGTVGFRVAFTLT